MGFFSWQTADTKQSIMNECTGKERTVYLLQPNGQKPIREDSYDGYGHFGGVDAYEWLAEQNLPKEKIAKLKKEGGDALRVYAIERLAEFSRIWVWKKTGQTFFRDELLDLKNGINWAVPQERFGGKTANEMRDSGELIEKPAPKPKFPLKFSFKEHAVYEQLPASEDCPKQGYF